MRRILGATALAALLAAPAFAQVAAPGAATFPTIELGAGEAYMASRLIGQRVYALDPEVDAAIDPALGVARGAEADWDDIGEINDLIMDARGQVEAVIVGVGGFLGLGERDVAVSLGALQIVPEQGDPGSAYLVLNTTRAALEAAPEFDRATALRGAMAGTIGAAGDAAGAMGGAVGGITGGMAPAPAAVPSTGADVVVVPAEGTAVPAAPVVPASPATTTETVVIETAPPTDDAAVTASTGDVGGTPLTATGTTLAGPAVTAPGTALVGAERPMLRRPAVAREGYAEAPAAELTTDDLTGMRVYGVGDEDVGEIGDLVMAPDGSRVEMAVLDVGGFLGLGERRVAVTVDEIQFLRGADGDVRAYIDATKEELEAQPEYAD